MYDGMIKGLMGVVANASLGSGGTVVGIVHQRLDERGHLHRALTLAGAGGQA
jgi:hypothetical protein